MKYILGDTEMCNNNIIIQNVRTECRCGATDNNKLIIGLNTAIKYENDHIDCAIDYLKGVYEELNGEIGRCISENRRDTANKLLKVTDGLHFIITRLGKGE